MGSVAVFFIYQTLVYNITNFKLARYWGCVQAKVIINSNSGQQPFLVHSMTKSQRMFSNMSYHSGSNKCNVTNLAVRKRMII